MTEVSYAFILAGVVIMAGFFGNVFFEKTKIPDVLVLLGIGILLGPVGGFVKPENLHHMAEYVGSLALLVILFEGGMDLDLNRLLEEFGSAALLVLLSFCLTTGAIASYLHFILGWEVRQGLLLGSIIGCTSAAIVIPIISRLNISEEIKTTLSVESALSDVLAVVLTISLIGAIQIGQKDPTAPFKAVVASFSTAIVIGWLTGLVWLKVLDLMRGKKLAYMLTLAAIMITFGSVRVVGGSGAIAVLMIGLVLGNADSFTRFLKIKEPLSVNWSIRFLHDEITFFIRTFFFVYLGMMFSFKELNTDFLMVCGSILLIMLLFRFVSTELAIRVYPDKAQDRFLIMLMMPRGLASAVLATLPTAAGIAGTENFVAITFGVIIVSNMIMTAGMFFLNLDKADAPEQPL
ncbi:cation:proton antiporter [Trichlorobacter lovleyi]|uniref:cation:proton antiporter domain-containing protein n=1 Tax=Trichlorobacter lovleyi TaxID=313985 RepID=UPI00223FFAEF|nr:cation:proton antiporter [Trichlorobacter lovleyi]QOX78855.1 cation:proton antiporter [Trichlorobacter lovleyi]